MDNATRVNKLGLLILGEDSNTFVKIFKRLASRKLSISSIAIALSDGIINIWYISILNFYIVLYNYFGALVVLLVQEVGYYVNLYISHHKLDTI